MTDCGDNSCRYATRKGGMRTNGGCRCDECRSCGAHLRRWRTHLPKCKTPEWESPWQRQERLRADEEPKT